MKNSNRFLAAPDGCGYLPEQVARMEYEHVEQISRAEYSERLFAGWRRFGHMLFRPRCPTCSACVSLRIDVERFASNRSQRRALRSNAEIELEIGKPGVTREKLVLYERYHAYRAQTRGWSWRGEDPYSFHGSFVSNPFSTEEWRYWLDGALVGLGYVDALPVGLSAIYFVYEPAEARRGLGTGNILRMIAEARARHLPHLYLGYHVASCISLAYKTSFRPYQFLGPDGQWRGSPAS